MTTVLQEQFNAVSSKYDRQRRFLIPCFDDFYGIPLEIAAQRESVSSILDVGAGTGLMSAFFYEQYPGAAFTLVDVSKDMLQKARDRFEGRENFSYLPEDFATVDLGEAQFDLVISGLAIHHLEHEQKQALFQKLYKALKPGGWFINADQVEGATPAIDRIYKENWRQKVDRSEGLTAEEKAQAYERVKLDIMAPLNAQLEWLSEAGFEHAACYYQYFNFVVMAAKK